MTGPTQAAIARKAAIGVARELNRGTTTQRGRAMTAARIEAALHALGSAGDAPPRDADGLSMDSGGIRFRLVPNPNATAHGYRLETDLGKGITLLIDTGPLGAARRPDRIPSPADVLRGASAVMARLRSADHAGDPDDVGDLLRDVAVCAASSIGGAGVVLSARTPFAPLALAEFANAPIPPERTLRWDRIAPPAFRLDLVHAVATSSIRFDPVIVGSEERDAMETMRTHARVAAMEREPWWT